TGELYWPRIVLKRVDLPEFGMPRIATLWPSSPLTSSCAAFQLTAFINLRTVESVEGSFARVETVSRSRGLTRARLNLLGRLGFFATSCPPVFESRVRRRQAPAVCFAIVCHIVPFQTGSTQGACQGCAVQPHWQPRSTARLSRLRPATVIQLPRIGCLTALAPHHFFAW